MYIEIFSFHPTTIKLFYYINNMYKRIYFCCKHIEQQVIIEYFFRRLTRAIYLHFMHIKKNIPSEIYLLISLRDSQLYAVLQGGRKSAIDPHARAEAMCN